jgi:hypothetical protein
MQITHIPIYKSKGHLLLPLLQIDVFRWCSQAQELFTRN